MQPAHSEQTDKEYFYPTIQLSKQNLLLFGPSLFYYARTQRSIKFDYYSTNKQEGGSRNQNTIRKTKTYSSL